MDKPTEDELCRTLLRVTEDVERQLGKRVRHLRTGNYYWIREVAFREADCVPVVVYHRMGNPLLRWTRPASEMLDGRFAKAEWGG